MKQKYSHAECYRILKVKPDCSWEQLRKAYKLQIQKWHPDRFQDGSDEKQAADEKIRFLNSAYKQLADYHRQHGQLPAIEIPPETPPQRRTRSTATTTSSRPTARDQAKTADSHLHKAQEKSGKLRIYITLTVVIAFSYWLFIQEAPEHHDSEPNPVAIEPGRTIPSVDQSPSNIDNTKDGYQQASPTSIPEAETSDNEFPPVNDDDYFTYGSSIGEVISVQGTPTRIDGDTWYYGESEVYFYEGEVIKWKRMPGSPLKARLVITDPTEDKKNIHKKAGSKSLFD